MNNMKRYFLFITILLASNFVLAQQYSFREIIELAKTRSIAYKQAETRKENRYWQYKVYKSNYNPQLSLNGTLPNYQRKYSAITQPDGTILFQPISNNFSDVKLGIEQSVSALGSKVFVNSTLNRYDNLTKSNAYLWGGEPLQFGFQQPLFQFNSLKWDKRIEPLRYEESKREYVEEMEDVAIATTQLYFNLLLAQITYNIAEKNLANSDTIYQIGEGRFNLGTIAENELLQLELSLLNARQSLAQASLDIETASLKLKSYLGLVNFEDFDLEVPEDLPEFSVEVNLALEQAHKNRSDALRFERQILEANRGVAKAKGDNGLNMDLYTSFGYTNQGKSLSENYTNSNNQLSVRLGFTIPLVDWGRSKSRIRTALANEELVKYTVEQEKMNFDQEVFTIVKRLDMLKTKIQISKKADEVANNRYNISKNRYLIGKINIVDLNIALQEKDKAKQDYIASLRNFWDTYYQVRKLTLYDFEKNRPLYSQEG